MRLNLRSQAIVDRQEMRLLLPFERIEPFIVAVQQAMSVVAIRQLVDIELRGLGFDSYVYVQLRPPKGLRDRVVFGTYPTDWLQHYQQRDLRVHDPLFGRAFDTIQPFLWQDVKDHEPSVVADRLIHGPSADAGLRAGAGIPLHGPAGAVASLHVSKDSSLDVFRPLFEEQRSVLQLIAFHAHSRVIELTEASPPTQVALSPRQREVLLWMIRGKTNWEIGELLEISEDTVRQHMIKSCRALGAINRAQAAAIAVSRGLIVP